MFCSFKKLKAPSVAQTKSQLVRSGNFVGFSPFNTKKTFGVFEHDLFNKTNPLLRGFDDEAYIPHSRYTTVLKKDIDRLGSKDELVEVKNGYGRNFLIPKGFAISSNKKNS